MTRRRLIGFLTLIPLVALASCSPFEGRVRPLSTEPGLKERVEAIANVARSLGWVDPWVPDAILVPGGVGLGTRKLKMSVDSETPTVVWQDQGGAQGEATQILVHARPYANQRSPLPAEAVNWSTPQLAEWLTWEWSAEKRGADTPEKQSRNAFFSFKFAEAIVVAQLGPGSTELARWRETIRDRRTFDVLVTDLKDQVKGIVAAQKDLAERKTTMERIEKAWLSVYHREYPQRFLTNTYQSFGESGWVDPAELALIDALTLTWKDWDTGEAWTSLPAGW